MNPLFMRQKLPMYQANVILEYQAPSPDEFVSHRMQHELHVDLFRLFVHRYSLLNNTVIGMPCGTGNVAIGALWEKRRFFGADTSQEHIEESIRRCYRIYTRYQGTFGINNGVMPDCDRLPADMVAGTHTPPEFRLAGGSDELADARAEAQAYGLEIKTSNVVELGLFTTQAIAEGEVIGYYWGRYFFNRLESTSERVIRTTKKRLGQGGLETMFIDGSRRCAVTYTNDPRNTEFIANASFEERDFDTRPVSDGDVTSPPLWMVMRLVARMEIPAGSEILVNYANDYFEAEAEVPSPTSGTEQGSVELTGDGVIPGESETKRTE